MTNCTETKPSKSADNDTSDASSVDTKIGSFEPSPVPLERVHSLWFEDGNVVVVAQESCFRVHKGVLSRHSAAFVKLLDGPMASDSEALSDQLGVVIDADNKIDGSAASVVHVSDSAHDFAHLLRIFYDGFDYLKYTRRDHFADLAAAARLAHKYTVPVVLAEATLRLQQLFPPTFDIWEATEDVRAAAERVRPPDAIEAVNLLRLAPGRLLRGHRRADGTLERLAEDDVERCWTLQQTLAEKTTVVAEGVCGSALWLEYAEKKKKCKCFRGLAKEVPWRWLTEVRGSDPLGRMVRDQLVWAERKFGACDTCMKNLRESERGLRKAYWAELYDGYRRDRGDAPV
ncbi:hypothetical protein GSI_09539 [Ganoderma sinense ZZ0214-1]|uniref:BTB domain-containing protein n=1 Tax=Ganoderma sinense ZZ0214-1 TaxID=1077348 RepID=A0A2G8S4A2_9APHY|nr:hypothetical protein GSI_09539 [Ganoderma sinense ZZ0214-1]